jgi:hypothetical protein
VGQFFASLLSIVGIMREMFKLIHLLLGMIDEQKKKAAEERERAREEAIERSKNAKTEDEFDKAQGDIVNNNP